MLKTLDDLKGLGLEGVLEELERGRIGHSLAMEWLGINSLNKLVEIMHYNGKRMPGHRPSKFTPEIRALIRSVCSRKDDAPRRRRPATGTHRRRSTPTASPTTSNL